MHLDTFKGEFYTLSKDFRKWTIYQSQPTKIKRSVIELKKKIAGIVEQACKEHIKMNKEYILIKRKNTLPSTLKEFSFFSVFVLAEMLS